MTQRDVARLIDMPTAIRLVREAFIVSASGKTIMPAKVYLSLPDGSDFRAMPAYVTSTGACGMKWVNVHPRNPRRGLPTVMALIIINDPASGFPLAVMDGLLITKLRTAASAAVAAEVLARPDSRIVGLIGCGAQADAQLLALAEVFGLSQVNVWGYLAKEAQRFCRRMRPLVKGISFAPATTVKDCVRDADIIVTLTPSRRPLVMRSWLRPGAHINAIGADGPGKQELDPRILKDATVVVDNYEQAVHGGEINVPVRRGQFHPKDIHASLGELLLLRKRLRQNPKPLTPYYKSPTRIRGTGLTVFDSTGIAIHDVVLGHEVTRQAQRRGIGLCVDFQVPFPTIRV